MSEREDQGEAFPQNAVQEAEEIRYTKEMLKKCGRQTHYITKAQTLRSEKETNSKKLGIKKEHFEKKVQSVLLSSNTD